MNNLSGATGSGMGNKIPSGYKMGRMQNFDPNQQKLYQQQFSYASPDSDTARLAGGDQSQFESIEAPAMRQFAGLQGNIASKFSGMGQGARNSSGFQNTMNQASSDFAQGLQSQRQQLQRQALMDLMGISNQLLGQTPTQNFMVKKQRKPSFLSRLFGGASSLAGAGIGAAFGGPFGAALGGSLGGAFGNGFSGQQSSPMDWGSLAGLPTSWGSNNSDLAGAWRQ